MKRLILNLLFVFILSAALPAQVKPPVQNDLITGLFSRLTKSTSDKERLAINDSINEFAHEYAASDSVFGFTYNARYLGQITSPDSIVKIITWNLLLESGKNKYFCYLVKKVGNGLKKIYELTGEHKEKPVLTDTIYNFSDWYGALYYDIRPFSDGQNVSWMILGLDYGNSDISRKIIDVINFKGDKPPTFGKKIFQTTNWLKYRQVFEYASMGSMTLRFTSDTTIVFDHLVPIGGSPESGNLLMGPDFSYDAFILSNGKWIFRLNIDARNKE